MSSSATSTAGRATLMGLATETRLEILRHVLRPYLAHDIDFSYSIHNRKAYHERRTYWPLSNADSLGKKSSTLLSLSNC